MLRELFFRNLNDPFKFIILHPSLKMQGENQGQPVSFCSLLLSFAAWRASMAALSLETR